MLIVLSPAKALDFETPPHVHSYSEPDFLNESARLVELLRRRSPQQLAALMKISDPLAALNAARYQCWSPPFAPHNAKQAVLAFDGDVYDGLAARQLDGAALDWAQQHLRILSGLYGVLRPLDLMQPYRLEMGTRLANPRGPHLYAFWGSRIARSLRAALQSQGGSGVLVNLASEEYFRSVRVAELGHRVVTPRFEDWNGGRYQVIGFHAKRARGLMSRFAIERRIAEPEGLKSFDVAGYAYCVEVSGPDEWVFRRRLD